MIKLNRSIDRGLSVIEIVFVSGAISLSVLAQKTGLPKPTLLRICATLENRRWLIRRSSDGFYMLGSAFPHASTVPDLVDHLISSAKETIVALTNETGLAVDLAASLGDGRVEIVDTTRSFKKHGIYPDAIGFRPSPSLSALGAAVLFAMPKTSYATVVPDLLARLPKEDRAAFAKLPELRKDFLTRGYATRAPDHWGRAVDYGALPSAIAVPIPGDGRHTPHAVWTGGGRDSGQRIVRNDFGQRRGQCCWDWCDNNPAYQAARFLPKICCSG